MVSIRQSEEERVRIGLLADSADPYWVEVRETLWQLASQTGELALLPFSAAIELVEIEFIAALPMTTTGKVQRRVLRLQEAERASS